MAKQIHFLTDEHKAFQTNESGILQTLAKEAWWREEKKCRLSADTGKWLALESFLPEL